MEDSELASLLAEIRDAQRDLLAEYRRHAGEALQLQRQAFELQTRAVEQQSVAVKNQLQSSRIYRIAVSVAAVVVAGVLLLLWTLL